MGKAGWRAAQPHLAAGAAAMRDTGAEPFIRWYRLKTSAALARRRGGRGPAFAWWFLRALAATGVLR
jgi:hypothetical protein